MGLIERGLSTESGRILLARENGVFGAVPMLSNGTVPSRQHFIFAHMTKTPDAKILV
jgi:hypothetical protein